MIGEGAPFQALAHLPSLGALQRARVEIPDDQLHRLEELGDRLRQELAAGATGTSKRIFSRANAE